jgi:hypothetical protein
MSADCCFELSLGLRFVNRLSITKDYENRVRILNEHIGNEIHFLDYALSQSNTSRDHVRLSDYSEERKNLELRPPAIFDPDVGPAEAWKFAHLEKTARKFVMASDHIPLRERGYVMWDYERLANLGMFDAPWQSPPRRSYMELMEEKVRVQRSYQRRTDIWLSGGRGWWSEQDESKVVYPGDLKE